MKFLLIAASVCLFAVNQTVAEQQTYEKAFVDRLLYQGDKDNDGKVTEAESKLIWNSHKNLDSNGDKALSREELSEVKIDYIETGAKRQLNILYKETPEEALFLDLYYPTVEVEGPLPVIIFAHGGGWAAGNKQNAAGRLYGPFFEKLLAKGFCVASINYRLWKPGGTAFVPESVEDTKDSARYLAKHSSDLGLDPERFFSMGGSAGGHLSQMLLLTPGTSEDAEDAPYTMVAGVSWFGFTNVEEPDLYVMDETKQVGDPLRGTTARILKPGLSGEQAAEVLREMSPTNWLSQSSPPLLVVHGDLDSAVSVKHAHFIEKKAEETGAPVEVVIVERGRHNWGGNPAYPTSPSLDEIIELTVDFFAKHLD